MTAPNWTPCRVTLGELKPWAENPRLMKKAQAKRLLDGWEALGQFQTIAIGPNSEVYDGHQRLNALLSVHGKSYEVVALRSDRPLTEEERQRIVFAANSPAGQWDADRLATWDTAKVLDWAGVDAAAWGDQKREVAMWGEMLQAQEAEAGEADAEPQVDRAAELQEKWQTALGQLWQIGPHRLLCGDSTRREDVERVMGGEKAGVMVTDPPYGIGLETDLSSIKTNWKGWKGEGGKYSKVIGDEKDYDATHLFVMFPELSEMFIWGANYFIDTLPNFGKDGSWIVWDKKTNQKEDTELSWKMGSEFELCWSKNKHKQIVIRQLWQGLYGTESQDVRNRVHPTQKPLQVINPFIEKYSKENDVIIDPFAGSGTTIVACQNLGRVCRAIELSPAYCAVILERMVTAFPDLDIHLIE